MSQSEIENVVNQLKALIANSKLESDIQRFLENHPFLVTQLKHTLFNVIISQLPLGIDFRADFAYLSENSSGCFIHLIEIESPDLNIFSRQDEFTQPYNHAFQQISDWISWAIRNQEYLRTILEPLFQGRNIPYLTPQCLLIAGHRSELTTTKRKRRFSAKSNQLPKGLNITTYDGFIESINMPLKNLPDIRCVRYRDQSFFAENVNQLANDRTSL